MGIIHRGAGGLTPRSYPDLAFWLEADRDCAVDDSVKASALTDQSFNSRSVSQSNAAKRMPYIANSMNGHPVLRGNTSDIYLENLAITGMDNLAGFTIVAVVKFSSTESGNMVISFQNTIAQIQVTGNHMYIYAGAGTYGGVVFTNTDPVVITSWYSGNGIGNAGRLKLYINGVQQALSFSETVPASLPTCSGFTLGKIHQGTYPFWGDLPVVFGYTRALFDTERERLQYKYGAKYGVTVT